MGTRQTAFLVLLALGIVLLLAAKLIVRTHWRTDIAAFSRRTFTFHVLLHPDRYVQPAYLTAVRWLTAAGALCIVAALGVVLYDIAHLGP